MADSVDISWNYGVSKDGDSPKDRHSFSYTPTGDFKGFNLVQSIPTAGTTLNFGSVVSVASFAVKNNDLANRVELSMNSDFSKPFTSIPALKSCPPILATGQAIYAKAYTAPILISTDFDGVT